MISDIPLPGDPAQATMSQSEAVSPPVPPFDFHAAAIRLQAFLRALPGQLACDAFGDAALMILLDLFIADHERQRLPIKSVCIGSGAPQSTALRYIERLEVAELIRRNANPADRRSAHIALTPEAETKLRTILTNLFGSR